MKTARTIHRGLFSFMAGARDHRENSTSKSGFRDVARKAVKKRRKTHWGGSRAGAPNYTTRLSREAIVEGLTLYGEDGKGKNGMVGFVLACLRENLKYGVAMMAMITPKQVDAHITRTDVVFKTLQELDQDLVKHGLPTSQEIFRLDYGNKVLDDDEVAVIDNATDAEE